MGDSVSQATVASSKTVETKTTVTVQPPQQVGVVLATMTAFWNWFDKRDVEKHCVAFFTLFLTYMELTWGMAFAEHNATRPGIEIAAILAAIGVPLTALQAAVINFYFTARAASAAAAVAAEAP